MNLIVDSSGNPTTLLHILGFTVGFLVAYGIGLLIWIKIENRDKK